MKLGRWAGTIPLVILVLAVSLHAQNGAPARRGSLSLGAVYAGSRLGYSYNYSEVYWDETLSLSDDLRERGQSGFAVGAGYLASHRLEVFGSLFYTKTGSHQSSIALSVPNVYYYDDIASDTFRLNRLASQLDILFGAKYHFADLSTIRPYLGAGACLSSASFEIMTDVVYTDVYDDAYFHTITITSVPVEKVKTNAVGGFVMAGVEMNFGKRLGAYAEGLYKLAESKVLHPLSVALDQPRNIYVNMGGFVAAVGLRFYL